MLSHCYQGELDLLALHQQQPHVFPYLLESVSVSPLSRFSLLFGYPQQQIRVPFGANVDFLRELDRQFWQEQLLSNQNWTEVTELAHLPFRGGWFLFLAYELAQQIEPVLRLKPDPFQVPLGIAVRIPLAVIIDHSQQQTYLLAERGYEQAFQQTQMAIAALIPSSALPSALSTIPALKIREEAPERFLLGVESAREYIQAGDVFQVNLSRAWQAVLPSPLDSVWLYQQLRRANPAPFACLAQFEDFSIISSSPERLVNRLGNVVNTRPIAGTRPRSADPIADQQWLLELQAHPKEQAEHVMLIDLERNDLGRVCEYGSVRVNELMVIESYQHVHHIVSNVQGRIRAGVSPGQLIRATFPGGTITGCPKVRCMEIIAELEQAGRGVYTGSVGYLNHNGDMDLNILIRTFAFKEQQLLFRTGAGIVMDSKPEHELKETRHKARGLLRALGDTTF